MSKKLIVLFIPLFYISLSLQAATPLRSLDEYEFNNNKNHTVKEITISGNEKTNNSFILNRIPLAEGAVLTPDTEKEITQSLFATHNFNEVIVYYTEDIDGIRIRIHVKEKYTLIPIPMVSYNGENYSTGLILLENNFLGQNKKIMLGGVYFDTGWLGFFMFSEPGVKDNSLIYSIFYQGSKKIYTNCSAQANKAVYQEYQSSQNKLQAAMGYKFLNSFDLVANGGFIHASLYDSYQETLHRPDSIFYYTAGTTAQLKLLTFSNISSNGISSRFEYQHGISQYATINNFDKLRCNVNYSFIPVFDHNIKFSLKTGYGDLPDVIEERIGGTKSFKSLPYDKITADNFAGSSIWYEVPLFSTSSIIFSGTCFAESGLYQRVNHDLESYKGIGSGIRLYLAGVAIPAVGFDLAKNLDSGNWEYSIVVGFSR